MSSEREGERKETERRREAKMQQKRRIRKKNIEPMELRLSLCVWLQRFLIYALNVNLYTMFCTFRQRSAMLCLYCFLHSSARPLSFEIFFVSVRWSCVSESIRDHSKYNIVDEEEFIEMKMEVRH